MPARSAQPKADRPPTRPGYGTTDESPVRRLEGLGSRASRIVEDAASILEEELSNGIDAARNVEQRLFATEPRERDPEAIVTRFRSDAHEIIDLAVDILGGALESLGSLTSRAVAIRDVGQDGATGAGRVPTLLMPDTVAGGGKADVAMSVENDSDQPTERFALNASDLLNAAGDRIPADRVAFSPKSVKIAPGTTARITVSLAVPKGTPAGTYSGLLQATKLEPVRAVLVVSVE